MIEFAMNTTGMTAAEVDAATEQAASGPCASFVPAGGPDSALGLFCKTCRFGKQHHAAPVVREMTVREMVLDIQEATSKMSVNNPHRRLLLRCAHALVQLAKRATPEKADAAV